MILCANPKAQYVPYKNEINAAIARVLESGTYILGEEVDAFEREFAQYLGAEFAIGCASGTDALFLALKALDVGPGDEVIVPSLTASPTVAAVVMAGAAPVYADVEKDYFTIDPDQIESVCTQRTKAIIAVHLYGQSASMDQIKAIALRRGLRVIEDCAQATGATYNGQKLGTLADVGCFSFFPTKNLGGVGDGGAVVCRDSKTAERVRRLRQYGWDQNRISFEAGVNSRLDALQAAILRVKLRFLDADNATRSALAAKYNQALSAFSLQVPKLRENATHVYHLYVIQTAQRDALVTHLQSLDIHPGIHYPVPVHHMPAFASPQKLHQTEQAARNIVSLPMYPGLLQAEQEKVIQALKTFYDESSSKLSV